GRSTPCVDESPSKSNISILDRRASTHGVDLRVDQGRHPPRASHAIPTDCGDLSKAGWVRLRGRERHGPEACLGRVGQDAQPRSCRVRRTAHTSKARPSLQGRTCSVPRNRTHPAIPQEPRCCRCRCICGCFGCCRGLCGCRAQPGCDPTFGPGLRRAPRTVRLSALPAPSGHRRAGAWWRCRSRCRGQAGHHRKNAKTR
ncbi:hypothetical protein SAMN05720615_1111, partial [Stenotrophomonas indicatrix]